MKKIFSKERISLGLDITTEAVKIVKLRFIPFDKTPLNKDNPSAGLSQELVELCDFGLESVSSPAALPEILKKIPNAYNIESVNLSVGGPSTVTRYVNFPKMNKDELNQALKFEAQKHIPFSLAEVDIDGHILKDDLPDNKILVLLAAVKKEIVQQRLKMLEAAGLKVTLIDIDSIALINAFNFNYPSWWADTKQKALALLNIGVSISNLDILETGIPRLSRDIHTGLNKTLDAIAPAINALADEVRVSFDYYESQSASCVEKIYLSGQVNELTGLKGALAASSGIEIDCWDPFRRITISNNIDLEKLKKISSQLAIAVGLALRK